MSNKLFIGNLGFSVNDSSLKTKFEQYGNVASAKVITDRDTGRSKGFGFVEMTTKPEAEAAIEGLNGADFEGRKINVSEAKPQAPRENNRSNFRR